MGGLAFIGRWFRELVGGAQSTVEALRVVSAARFSNIAEFPPEAVALKRLRLPLCDDGANEPLQQHLRRSRNRIGQAIQPSLVRSGRPKDVRHPLARWAPHGPIWHKSQPKVAPLAAQGRPPFR